jgi:DNA polymerase-3 subunit alpha
MQGIGNSCASPDINESEDVFTVSGENIRFGLVAVKNIGRGLIKQVVAERQKKREIIRISLIFAKGFRKAT